MHHWFETKGAPEVKLPVPQASVEKPSHEEIRRFLASLEKSAGAHDAFVVEQCTACNGEGMESELAVCTHCAGLGAVISVEGIVWTPAETRTYAEDCIKAQRMRAAA